MPEEVHLIPVVCPRCGNVTPKMAKHLLLLTTLRCQCGYDIDLTRGAIAAEIQKQAAKNR